MQWMRERRGGVEFYFMEKAEWTESEEEVRREIEGEGGEAKNGGSSKLGGISRESLSTSER